MESKIRRVIAASAVVCMAAVLSAPAQAQKAEEPPATTRLMAYLQAFNSGDRGEMKAFFETQFAASVLNQIPVATRMARFEQAKAALGSLRFEKIAVERPSQTFALAKAGNGEDILLRVSVEKDPPFKLLAIILERVEDPNDVIIADPKADEAELVASIKAYLEAEAGADEFSGVVLVAKDSRVLFHEAYGDADREAKAPNRKDTKFNLGSINKSFTRVAIHQLERQGKLGLDDPIKKFLPDYPNAAAAEKVTIRHLLDMTSGIGDFFGARYDATPKETIRALRDYLPLFADLPLEFEPGARNRYSNGGFVVLGLIIEKASGEDYYAFVRENIFRPCGMSDTDSFPRDADVPNLARGYTRAAATAGGRVLNLATLPGRGSSAGGGYSTAEDMLKYIMALKDKKILLPDIASGLAIAGGAPGINARVDWDQRTGYAVIVLSNYDPPAAGQVARRIISWLPQ